MTTCSGRIYYNVGETVSPLINSFLNSLNPSSFFKNTKHFYLDCSLYSVPAESIK